MVRTVVGVLRVGVGDALTTSCHGCLQLCTCLHLPLATRLKNHLQNLSPQRQPCSFPRRRKGKKDKSTLLAGTVLLAAALCPLVPNLRHQEHLSSPLPRLLQSIAPSSKFPIKRAAQKQYLTALATDHDHQRPNLLLLLLRYPPRQTATKKLHARTHARFPL